MIGAWFNWRTLLALIAIAIVIVTIFYSDYLAGKIGKDETRKVESWIQAQQTLLTTTDSANIALATRIIAENIDIPIIETNEKDSITNYRNLDTFMVNQSSDYLKNKLEEFKHLHPPLRMVLSVNPLIENKYYYGESRLRKEVRYYPIIQLIIVALFIIITFALLRTNYRSTQNQLWAGMAKETAHQLGTPLTSLKGWVEMLKEQESNGKILAEMEKDVSRLQLISDRFGKIGSHPQLEETNIIQQLEQMIDYMKKRAGKHVAFALLTHEVKDLPVMISPPLFDWVIENLLKNALDAMEGKGSITVDVHEKASKIVIDITDTGKGISKKNVSRIFNPGFTTKKRGWGLGLTLTKRIVEQYHEGSIYVKWSEPGKGTTFRILLNKG